MNTEKIAELEIEIADLVEDRDLLKYQLGEIESMICELDDEVETLRKPNES